MSDWKPIDAAAHRPIRIHGRKDMADLAEALSTIGPNIALIVAFESDMRPCIKNK